MFVEEMLFILGHRDVENVDAFIREMDDKVKKWDYWSKHDPYAVNTLLDMREMSDKLEAVETQAKGLEGQLKAVKKTLVTWVYHYPTNLREALERALGEPLIEGEQTSEVTPI